MTGPGPAGSLSSTGRVRPYTEGARAMPAYYDDVAIGDDHCHDRADGSPIIVLSDRRITGPLSDVLILEKLAASELDTMIQYSVLNYLPLTLDFMINKA
eukprot:748025-Hanusia_phi.AAC.1